MNIAFLSQNIFSLSRFKNYSKAPKKVSIEASAKKMSDIAPRSAYNHYTALNFTSRSRYRKFYSYNTKTQAIQEHKDSKEASQELNLNRTSVLNSLAKRSKYSGDYIFFYADEVETVDEKGNTTIDKDKLNKILIQKHQDKRGPKSTENEEFYAIDKYGNYQKFYSRSDVDKALNIENFPKVAAQMLNTPNYTYMGYTFVLAKDIEVIDKDGNETVNIKKINDISKAIDKSIYAIFPNGTYKKYKNQTEAAKDLNIPIQRISNVLSGLSASSKGLTFVYSKDVESRNKNNETEVNLKLIDSFAKMVNKSFYVIRKNGDFDKFDDVNCAAKALKTNTNILRLMLNYMYYPKKGYTLVFGREVDVRDENGKVKIDKDALIEVLTSKGIDKDAFDTDKFVYNVENHLGGYHLKFDE